MTSTERVAQYEELVRRFASVLSGSQLYGPDHPLVLRGLEAFTAVLGDLHAAAPSIIIGVIGQELVVEDTPLLRTGASLADLLGRLHCAGIERITIDRGVTVAEVGRFVEALTTLTARRPPPTGDGGMPSLPHIRVSRFGKAKGLERSTSDMATIRQLYARTVKDAQVLWESAATGMPDMAVARVAIEDLAEAVAQNRTAVLALTAMKAYDNYTFTHNGERVHPYYGSGAGAADRRTAPTRSRLVGPDARHRKNPNAG